MQGSICSRTALFSGFLLLFGAITGCGAAKEERKETTVGQKSTSPRDRKSIDPVPDNPADIPKTTVLPALPESMDPEIYPLEAATPPPTDHHIIQVFYATDRLPAGEWPIWRSYGLPIASGLFSFIFLVAAFRRSKKFRYGILALLMAGASLWTTQQSTLRAQRFTRAEDNEDRDYGADRHESFGLPILEMGICEVSVPPDHRVGRVESPSVLKLEFHEDPDKHVVVNRTMLMPEDEVMRELQSCIKESTAKQALVFIHGYNVSFDDAVKRTAQIAHDLKFDGAPICYSWPSQGGLAKYTYDEASIDWTVPQLESFLNRIVEGSGATTIHLVAHSMGNRALVEVLERIYLQDKENHYRFGQIILAAPDVDASSFRNRYVPILKEMSERTTLYASSNDRALKASRGIHGATRAGLSGEHLLALVGVETVDASPIDTSLIGHSYYGDNPIMIKDLQSLVHEGVSASARDWLEERLKSPELLYWQFKKNLANYEWAKNTPEL